MKVFYTRTELAEHLLETLFGGELPPPADYDTEDALFDCNAQFPMQIDTVEYEDAQRSVWALVTNGAAWPF